MEPPSVGTSPDLPQTWIESDRQLARMFGRPLQSFLAVEAGGGIMLVIATVVALVWANSPWSASYETLFHTHLTIDIGGFSYDESLVHVINDGLMTLFFFVVGLEIKREWVAGELRDRRAAVLPAVAALGGMVVPALRSTPRSTRAGRGSARMGHPDGDRHRLRPRRRRRPREPGAGAAQDLPADPGDRRRHRRHRRDRRLLHRGPVAAVARRRGAPRCWWWWPAAGPRSATTSSTSCSAPPCGSSCSSPACTPRIAGVVMGLLTPGAAVPLRRTTPRPSSTSSRAVTTSPPTMSTGSRS